MAPDISEQVREMMLEDQRKSRPSLDLAVYCDKHLGVRMVRSESWLVMEHGTASADANPLRSWRCPKRKCQRCYDATMLGYYTHKGVGSRIDPDTPDQRRCLNHAELPFMYIGKVNESRQFLCPFYKCNQRGDVVASHVIDEEVGSPENPQIGLSMRDQKQAREMSVFLAFASASGIALDEGSARNVDRDPPDIICSISGKPYWFELGRIIGQEVAEKTSPKRRHLDTGFSYSREKPFIDIVTDKAAQAQHYDTSIDPVDLILHFDLRLGTRAAIDGLIGQHAARLESLVNDGLYSRVWIFDEYTNSVLWPRSLHRG